ncbi:hypothetical protein [Pontixanthobacter sp.]|uniref:hypothetical protein n=1 Tax=Pontixanthobacter sp. TaxID=2792078 RepID=UPI003C7E9774
MSLAHTPDRNTAPGIRIFGVWAVLSAIFIATGFQQIVQGQFPDPDDALRLVQVRDLLAGQDWFDLTQYRIDPAAGTAMHWSRLVDIPLAAMIAAFTPVIGSAAAETVTLIAVPSLLLGGIVLIMGRLGARLFDLETATFACLILGLSAPLIFQLQPMRIDHHGWQIALAALALWGIAHRSAGKGGIIAGTAMALGLSISIELLPLTAAFGGILAFRWLRDPEASSGAQWWLTSYMAALASGLVLVFLATRGLGDAAQYCDVISPAHLAFFAVTAAGTAGIAAMTSRSQRVSPVLLIAAFAANGAAGGAVFGLFSPGCLATPFAQLDPVVRDFWYIHIAEGRPIWEQDLTRALPALVQLVAGLAAAIALALRSRGGTRIWWLEYSALLMASLALSLLVWRSAAFAALIAALPLGWLTVQLLGRCRNAVGIGAKLAPAAALALILVPAAPITIAKSVMPGGAAPPVLPAGDRPGSPPRAQSVAVSQCQMNDQAAKLDALPEGTILAPLDLGPAILLQSHHSVVATSHHRAELAMRDVIVAFAGPLDGARGIAVSHGARYIVMCSDLSEPNIYADANPSGLAALLIADAAPDWLEPVTIDSPDAFRVWTVR